MISDSLFHASRYEHMHPFFAKAFAYLKSLTPDTLPAPGAPVLLEKDLVYASVQRYNTVPDDTLPFESHRNYIDLHYLVSGREAVFCCSRENLRDPSAYDEKKDCETALFAGNSFRIPLHTKDFLILYPGEAHQPRCSLDIDSPVCKIVVKIRAL